MSDQSESLKKMCDWFEKMLANFNAKEQIAPFALCSLLSLSFLKSNCGRIAQVAHDKKATGAICCFSQANCSFDLLLTKNEKIAQKTDE